MNHSQKISDAGGESRKCQDDFESLEFGHQIQISGTPESQVHQPDAVQAQAASALTSEVKMTSSSIESEEPGMRSIVCASMPTEFRQIEGDLDLFDLIKRCEGETGLAIDIINTSFTQGTTCCDDIQHSLEEGRLKNLLFQTASTIIPTQDLKDKEKLVYMVY
jgi:hypothetical protein